MLPLYGGLRNGLTSLVAGLNYGIYRPDETRRIISGSLTAGFRGSGTDATLGFGWKAEGAFTASDVKANEYNAWTNISLATVAGELGIYAHGIAHTPGFKGVFPGIRGYSEGPGGTLGSVVKTTLTPLIIKIRNGLWNPNIYIEDIFGALFFDAAMTDCVTQYSYGTEVTFEVKGFFNLASELGYRLSITREGNVVHGLVFKGIM
jgi:hypothetical protein